MRRFQILLAAVLLLILCGCAERLSFRAVFKKAETFTNPILPAPSYDPWMVYHKGWYYYCQSMGRHIFIRKTRRITDLATSPQGSTSPSFLLAPAEPR